MTRMKASCSPLLSAAAISALAMPLALTSSIDLPEPLFAVGSL